METNKMKRILFIALIAVFAVALCACSTQTINDQLADALNQVQDNSEAEAAQSDLQELLDSLKDDLDATVTDDGDAAVPDDADAVVPDEGDAVTDGEDADVPDDDGFETGEEDYDTYTDLFEIKYIRSENDKEVFGLRHVVWVNPDDTDLIEQYGLQDAWFDDDYELVVPDENFQEFYAFPDVTLFTVVDYSTDLTTKDVPCEQFIDILNETYDGTMLAECTYTGNYIYVVSQVYVP